ncbi:hypothetical protein [Dendronalium sp. ChiSLP03b]|uniref:hypothetical protein n=1 Tax=Dendronalium sp. ChiSLP03b TaxID=3075381 RepID=UPI002AD7A4C1|nr:hypothetical protein [Dendronalium sp. ChiSLP03b]
MNYFQKAIADSDCIWAVLEPTFRTQNWHTEKAVSKPRKLVKLKTINLVLSLSR